MKKTLLRQHEISKHIKQLYSFIKGVPKETNPSLREVSRITNTINATLKSVNNMQFEDLSCSQLRERRFHLSLY